MPTAADFEEFVRASERRLLTLGIALCGNEHDGRDLTQEALVRVGLRWRKASIDNPMAYTRATMVRLNVDRIRRLRRERLMAEVPDTIESPAEFDGVDQQLLRALRLLTPKQRSALALRYLDDLDTREIAHALRCSEGTVRTHLSRGLAEMRRVLENEHERESARW